MPAATTQAARADTPSSSTPAVVAEAAEPAALPVVPGARGAGPGGPPFTAAAVTDWLMAEHNVYAIFSSVAPISVAFWIDCPRSMRHSRAIVAPRSGCSSTW